MQLGETARQMYIDGQWVDADGGKIFEVRNPADQTVVGIIPDAGVAETRRAIEAADRAFTTWSRTSTGPTSRRGAIWWRPTHSGGPASS